MYPSKDAQPIVTLSMPSLRADQKSPLSLEVPHPVPWRRQSIAPVIPIMRGHTEKRQPHWLCKCLSSQKIHAAGRFILRMRLMRCSWPARQRTWRSGIDRLLPRGRVLPYGGKLAPPLNYLQGPQFNPRRVQVLYAVFGGRFLAISTHWGLSRLP